MKVAVLGNGASRNLFTDPSRYYYLIGCNIPWTKVDSTVVMDVNVLDHMNIPCNMYVSRNAWRECNNRERHIGYLLELFDPLPEYDSAAHVATRIIINMGAKEIDIYGCDSWFRNDTESYTHQWVDSRAIDMTKNVSVWRSRWYDLMAKNPEITFKFIGE